MNDRRLTELAAKACALPECGWMGGTFTYVKDNTFTTWDPLNDDGDALRLAMALDMSVDVEEIETSSYAYAGQSPRVWAMEMWRDDKHAATRRAIVRAAAALAPTGETKGEM